MTKDKAQVNYTAVLAIYMVGLLIGGLYVGMASPVRTVVQEHFGIGDAVGIWMITIYTLFYAALIPVIGKLADIFGRKRVFIACNLAFAAGSLACGLAPALSSTAGFCLLLAGRVVQAAGACGMIPVANAEVGATFPKERKGMALGLIAAAAGVSNVLGAAAGSAVLDLFGASNWGMLFLIAVPLCVCLAAVSAFVLPKSSTNTSGKLDLLGSVLFVLFVLCVLMALRNLDYFSLPQSLTIPGVWGFAAAAIVLAVVFGAVERRVADPVFHMEYLHSKPIVITMAVSFFVGCTIITMTLVPEFAEFALGLAAGKGGYFVVIIGLFGMAGPPFAGKLIDKFGPKPVMLFGLVVGAAGFAFLAIFACASPSFALVAVGLVLIGLGMGFTMGAPCNYMIFENTSPEESSSAIATITLVRQIGTTVAPALLVGFIGSGTMAGYQAMLLCVVVFNAFSAVLMLAYRPRKAA